jgi:Rho-binding antiterminator
MSKIQQVLVTGKTHTTATDAGGISRTAAANVMTTNPSKYYPISCEFHDLLETHATARKLAQIRFRDGEGAVQLRSAAIIDVFARAGAEYLSMSTGETLRLDQLIEVDDAKLAEY